MIFSPASSRLSWRTDEPFFGRPLPDLPIGRSRLDGAAAWLRRLPIDWRRLAPFVAFDPDGYLRRTIAIEGGWEVVLCSWLPQQGTAMHGHGEAVGVIRLLVGTLTEAERGPCGSVKSRRIVPGRILREDRGVVHQVVNDGEAPALSLHLYHPPLLQAAAPGSSETSRISARARLP